MDVSIGKLVHYRLTSQDVTTIEAMRSAMQDSFDLPPQIQQQIMGEAVQEGETYPAVVVKTQGSRKGSLQVALPGMPAAFFVQGRSLGMGPGEWIYPELSDTGMYRDVLQQAFPQSSGSRAQQPA